MSERKKFWFESRAGQKFWVEVPPPAPVPSRAAFSIFKSGSTLLYNLLSDMCRYNGMPTIDFVAAAFNQGVKFHDIPTEIEKILFQQGYMYLGFRTYFEFDPSFDFDAIKKILLVRDPRDVLVSLYFSQRYSHVIPEQGEAAESLLRDRKRALQLDIEAFVRERVAYVRRPYERYLSLAWDENLKLYRYENVIFEKRSWIYELASYLDLSVDEGFVDLLLEKYDVMPGAENPLAHIRQVRPGNYLKHLRAECIEHLTKSFRDILERYGYDT